MESVHATKHRKETSSRSSHKHSESLELSSMDVHGDSNRISHWERYPVPHCVLRPWFPGCPCFDYMRGGGGRAEIPYEESLTWLVSISYIPMEVDVPRSSSHYTYRASHSLSSKHFVTHKLYETTSIV